MARMNSAHYKGFAPQNACTHCGITDSAHGGRRLRSISLPFSTYNPGTRLLTAQAFVGDRVQNRGQKIYALGLAEDLTVSPTFTSGRSVRSTMHIRADAAPLRCRAIGRLHRHAVGKSRKKPSA